MNRKEYEKPVLEVIRLENDVIRTSDCPNDTGYACVRADCQGDCLTNTAPVCQLADFCQDTCDSYGCQQVCGMVGVCTIVKDNGGGLLNSTLSC